MQEIGLLRRFGGKPPHRYRAPAVQHAVAGGAVGNAAAQQLGLAGHGLCLGNAAGQHHGARFQDIAVQVDHEASAERHDVARAPLAQHSARVPGVLRKALHHLFAGQPRHAQIVVHLLGLGQQRFAAVHHQHGLAALAQVQRRRKPRGACADDNAVKIRFHLYSLSGVVTAPQRACRR